MESKVFWQSKTFWLNLLGTLLAIVSASDLVPLLPPAALPYVAGVTAVLNIILRSLKTQQAGALTWTSQASEAINASRFNNNTGG